MRLNSKCKDIDRNILLQQILADILKVANCFFPKWSLFSFLSVQSADFKLVLSRGGVVWDNVSDKLFS